MRSVAVIFFTLMLLGCKRTPPRVGVVNPEDVFNLKSPKWTLMPPKPVTLEMDDEENWMPVQPNSSSDTGIIDE